MMLSPDDWNFMPTATKKELLLKRLRLGFCTPVDALTDCKIMSLAQRISEWRAKGYEFAQVWVKTGTSRVAAYKLTKEPR